jgi:YD repeat-containing protein
VTEEEAEMAEEPAEQEDEPEEAADEVYLLSQKVAESLWADGYTEHITTDYEYDDQGYLIKSTETEVDTDSEGAFGTITEYENNEQGDCIREVTTDLDGNNPSETTMEYEYDADGNRVKQMVYNSDGKMTASYEYDAQGNEVTWNADWDMFGTFTRCYENEYDAQGNLVKQVMTDENGEAFSTKQFSYDADDNPTKMVYYENDVQTSVTEYEYDENNNLIKETETSGTDMGDRVWTTTYEYTVLESVQ